MEYKGLPQKNSLCCDISLMSNNYVWVYFESDKVRVEESNEGVNVRHVELVQYTI